MSAIKILDLSYRSSKNSEFPWLLVNCVFKLDDNEDHPYRQRALGESQHFTINMAADTPEQLDRGKFKKMWVLSDPEWSYVEKFDVFWFRQRVSDCSVTRSCLQELRYFEEHGYFPSFYRHVSEGVFLRHLRCLGSYWD